MEAQILDETPRDEEGLLLKYDVVICGTGLVQSILASALARAGKSVLHCDAQGYYGELDAVLSLPYIYHGQLWKDHANVNTPQEMMGVASFEQQLTLCKPSLQLLSTHSLKSIPVDVGTSVQTPYGSGIVVEMTSTKVAISLHAWTLANGKAPTLFIGIPLDMNDKTNNVDSNNDDDDATPLQTFLQSTCRIRPTLLVQTENLLQRAARSFAIDVTPSLIFGSGAAVSGFLTSNVSEYVDFKPIEEILWLDCSSSSTSGKLSRVPCSKGDVFETKILNPLEKRKLMKFLQLVMDFSIYEHAEAYAEQDVVSVSESVQSLNERQLNQGRSLVRPANKAVNAEDFEALRKAVELNSIDFETFLSENQKLTPSLKSLVRYALALETSSKPESIRNGMRRLGQHLQGLGKFGPTAFLAPMYGSGEFSQAFCRSAAVHGATYLLRRDPKSVQINESCVTGVVLGGSNDASVDKKIACSHVIVPANSTTRETSSRHLLRRVSIISNKVVLTADAQRHIILIPPSSTLGNENVIHAIALDHSVKVAPLNCTLLHLTTTVEGNIDDSILDGAVKALLPLDAVELFHVSFCYELHDDCSADEINGLHVCRQTGQTLASDDAFLVAKATFDKICPDMEFLALSEKLDNVIKANLGGREEDDEERDTLDKAAELLQATTLHARNE